MASIPRKTPLARGAWAGSYAVRYRLVRGGRQRTGYLPTLELLAAYTAYEAECWNAAVVPDPPELRFANQFPRELADAAHGETAHIATTAAAPETSPTLAEWVGPSIAEQGQFFDCLRPGKSQREQRRRAHVSLVAREEVAMFSSKPLDRLTFDDYDQVFDRWLACPTCVARVNAAGKLPGSESAPWSDLVPKIGTRTWDGETCAAHRTEFKLKTYEARRQMFVVHFTATSTVKARRAGIRPVESVVTTSDYFDSVIFKDSLYDGGDPSEELRYGLAHGQVQDLCDASPGHLRALPTVAAWTFSRGGQELTGPRIGDVQPENPDAVRDLDANPCGGIINLHNFRRLNPNGSYENSPEGKTRGSRRRCPVPADAMTETIRHIRRFRGTPDPGCPGCLAGHGHWRTSDHANNPHVFDEHGPIRCPMAADAPLWVDERGEWLKADDYTRTIWPDICERAAVTEETLGWKPLPKHFRSTGTTLHMEGPDPDVGLVVLLGGWENENMIRQHYYRRSPASLIAAAQRVEDHLVLRDLPDDAAEVDKLRRQLAWSARLLDQAQRRLIQAGIAPAGTRVDETTVVSQPARAQTPTRNDTAVLGAVTAVVLRGGRGKNAVLEALGLAAARKNYVNLEKAFVRLQLPRIPNNWANMSEARQRPYREDLRAALARHGHGDTGLRVV